MKTLFAWSCVLSIAASAFGGTPQVLDDRQQLDLLAENTRLLTPTGIAVDERGRLFVLECHTHFRPKNYEGPTRDRVLLFQDQDGDGKFEKRGVFRDGLTLAMGIVMESPRRAIVATRADIRLLEDADDDGQAETETILVRLDTPGNYPHNGLSGIALGPLGNIHFALGENLGAPYSILGSDGKKLSGGGEGGNIYSCAADGSRLRRAATGFWNTFGLGFDAGGNLFAVDNDPDSRPPCRLLHIVGGGDYGFRFRNGRKGVHPFTAWDGELPGTLPMVAGTGEAPCDVLAYQGEGFPKDYQNKLLVTSWGDHRIEAHALQPKGTSFEATMKTVVQGGDDFRPVGLAVGPDGSLYFTDWVLKSYPLHGRGRLWRLRPKKPPAIQPGRASDVGKVAKQSQLIKGLRSRDVNYRRACARRIAELDRGSSAAQRVSLLNDVEAAARNEMLWAYLRAGGLGTAKDLELLHREMGESDPRLVAEAARRWPQAALDAWSAKLDSQHDPEVVLAAMERSNRDLSAPAVAILRKRPKDPFVFSTVAGSLGRGASEQALRRLSQDPSERVRLAALFAWKTRAQVPVEIIRGFLRDAAADVRRAGIQWVAESGRKDLVLDLERSLQIDPTPRIFTAYLAAREKLDGVGRSSKGEFTGEQHALAALRNANHSPAVRRLALRSLPADCGQLKAEDLSAAIQQDDVGLRREAIWTLRDVPRGSLVAKLIEIVEDESRDRETRADSVDAIAAVKDANKQASGFLQRLAASKNDPLQGHARRVLRGTDPPPDADARPQSLDGWLKEARAPGDANNGRRVFFQRQGASCHQCHRVQGRGGIAGPDLTLLPPRLTDSRLVESLFNPSKEIAPQFTSWTVLTKQGVQVTGILLRRNSNGNVMLADPKGKVHRVNGKDVEQLVANKKSLMPDKLLDRLTVQEFRDLMAFLRSLK
ncbi:MAG: c-type cytochrome [Planctomycetales bacterium]